MKTFEDLVFVDHVIQGGKHAYINFKNGYGVSVITGKHPIRNTHLFYTDDKNPYEVAILFNGDITYDTGLTNDVIGHCNEERVTEIMKQVQELKVKHNKENK